jgi:hypothetical protein
MIADLNPTQGVDVNLRLCLLFWDEASFAVV